MSHYINEFLGLKCSGDVLNAVAPVSNSAKEISEAMGIIRQVKKIVLPEPMKYTLVDLCAGNALTAIIAVHLLPILKAIAVDKKPRVRPGHRLVKRFEYVQADLNDFDSVERLIERAGDRIILTACHPCGELAWRAIRTYQTFSECKHLILMPCCHGQHTMPQIVDEKMGKYLAWCLALAMECNGNLIEDNHVISPCRGIITAYKGGKVLR